MSASDLSDTEAAPAETGAPLQSSAATSEAPAEETAGSARPPAPALPQFKPSTFVLTFLFVLGIWMLFDNQARNGVATAFGLLLGPLIGFGGRYVLLTMFLAGAIEMALTALAYNWATDWVKTARVQKWSGAFRKVQMEAMRSGKKDRVEALKPHQLQIARLSGELSMAQLKGMAVTWFLVIAIYTWVGLFIAHTAVSRIVNVGGTMVNLMSSVGPIPDWIVLFSLYTFPLSFVLRRALKHYSLRRHELKLVPASPGVAEPTA